MKYSIDNVIIPDIQRRYSGVNLSTTIAFVMNIINMIITYKMFEMINFTYTYLHAPRICNFALYNFEL